MVAGCTEAQLIVFDVHMKRMLSRITAHEDDINSVCVGSAEHGSNTIVTGSDDKLIKVREAQSVRVLQHLRCDTVYTDNLLIRTCRHD